MPWVWATPHTQHERSQGLTSHTKACSSSSCWSAKRVFLPVCACSLAGGEVLVHPVAWRPQAPGMLFTPHWMLRDSNLFSINTFSLRTA